MHGFVSLFDPFPHTILSFHIFAENQFFENKILIIFYALCCVVSGCPCQRTAMKISVTVRKMNMWTKNQKGEEEKDRESVCERGRWIERGERESLRER